MRMHVNTSILKQRCRGHVDCLVVCVLILSVVEGSPVEGIIVVMLELGTHRLDGPAYLEPSGQGEASKLRADPQTPVQLKHRGTTLYLSSRAACAPRHMLFRASTGGRTRSASQLGMANLFGSSGRFQIAAVRSPLAELPGTRMTRPRLEPVFDPSSVVCEMRNARDSWQLNRLVDLRKGFELVADWIILVGVRWRYRTGSLIGLGAQKFALSLSTTACWECPAVIPFTSSITKSKIFRAQPRVVSSRCTITARQCCYAFAFSIAAVRHARRQNAHARRTLQRRPGSRFDGCPAVAQAPGPQDERDERHKRGAKAAKHCDGLPVVRKSGETQPVRELLGSLSGSEALAMSRHRPTMD